MIMKKTIRVALSAILVTVLVTACILPMTALEIRRWYGDIDNNGDVDIADARAALIAAVGIGAELEDMDFVAADVNFDDIITTDDACIILKMAAGIADKATYAHPHTFAAGVEHVFVNGVQAVESGRHTGALAGVILKK